MNNVVHQTNTDYGNSIVQGYRSIEELVPQHWMEGRVIANGIQQHFYRTGGAKPPLVCFHGFGESGLSWLRVAHILEQEYDVILVDARGHGSSARATTGFSSEILAEDAIALLHALQLENVCLLGASMGGITAAQLAAYYPHLVNVILLEDPPWDLTSRLHLVTSRGYQARFKKWLRWLQQLKTQPRTERLSSAMAFAPHGAAAWPEEEYVAWVEACVQLDLELVAGGADVWSVMQLSLCDLLPRITCPILLMRSAYAFAETAGPQLAQEELLVRSEIVIADFVRAGHCIHRGAFEEFVTVVQLFLQTCLYEVV